MGKVICFYTRQEVKDRMISIEQGEALIERIIEFELDMGANEIDQGMIEMLSSILGMIENNSGANKYHVLDKMYKRKI